MRRHPRIWFALGVAAFVVLTACDDAGESSSGTPDDTSASTADTAAEGLTEGCALVGRSDAEELFDAPAELEEGTSIAVEVSETACIWGTPFDADTYQLLQFRIWEGEQFYSESIYEGARHLDIGDGGFVAVESGSVTIQWVQDGQTAHLAYSGSLADDTAAKAPQVEEMAERLAGEIGGA